MRLSDTQKFTATVTVALPSAEGEVAASFTGHFVALSVEDLAAADLSSNEGQKAYLRRVFIGWGEDLIDDSGETEVPLPVSEAARDRLIGDFFVRRALMQTYVEALGGAKRGN